MRVLFFTVSTWAPLTRLKHAPTTCRMPMNPSRPVNLSSCIPSFPAHPAPPRTGNAMRGCITVYSGGRRLFSTHAALRTRDTQSSIILLKGNRGGGYSRAVLKHDRVREGLVMCFASSLCFYRVPYVIVPKKAYTHSIPRHRTPWRAGENHANPILSGITRLSVVNIHVHPRHSWRGRLMRRLPDPKLATQQTPPARIHDCTVSKYNTALQRYQERINGTVTCVCCSVLQFECRQEAGHLCIPVGDAPRIPGAVDRDHGNRFVLLLGVRSWSNQNRTSTTMVSGVQRCSQLHPI